MLIDPRGPGEVTGKDQPGASFAKMAARHHSLEKLGGSRKKVFIPKL